jgi:predicted phosphohydrolase
MKIQYASDLHLEFRENRELLVARPLRPEGDILILAGDIVPFIKMYEYADFFDYISEHFNMTYWLPGNHEYYHSDISERSGHLYEKIKDNVVLVNNTSIQTGNLNLVFSTLWTLISPANQFELIIRYSDFHVIQDNGKLLSIQKYNAKHSQCISFLKEEFTRQKQGKLIVVTHHLPTFMNYPEKYKGDALSEAFATELSDLIETAEPDYWIFGHHHSDKGNFNIGKTRLITNQMGYVMYNEHKGFDAGKIIEV